MVSYHPCLPHLKQILQHHLPVLHTSDKLKLTIPRPPIVAYRRPSNLKHLLVRASVLPSKNDMRAIDSAPIPVARPVKILEKRQRLPAQLLAKHIRCSQQPPVRPET